VVLVAHFLCTHLSIESARCIGQTGN
jgi:hypothetical protein